MIRIVVALQAEARPLVSHYRLKAVAGAFPLYQSEGLWLVVSGVGKTRAAAATANLHAAAGEGPGCAWINVGIAGHRERPVGEAILADKIVDGASGRRWYPPRLPGVPPPSASVLTVDHVEERFTGDWVYEMEAAGICAAASRLSAVELVQCYKIISDNRRSSPQQVTARGIETLIEHALESITRVVEAAGRLAREPAVFELPIPAEERRR